MLLSYEAILALSLASIVRKLGLTITVNRYICLAESEGFEPPVPFSTSVFKTDALDHSANSPKSHLSESNQQPIDYKSIALPIELRWLNPRFFIENLGGNSFVQHLTQPKHFVEASRLELKIEEPKSSVLPLHHASI